MNSCAGKVLAVACLCLAGTSGAVQAGSLVWKWAVIESGGTQQLIGATLLSGVAVAQPAAGHLRSESYRLGVGYWYGMTGAACPVIITGDVNQAGGLAVSDIVYLVNYVFKAGPTPLPCLAAGDVNCTGDVASSDIVYLVNAVLKAGTPPCDVCSSWPADWSCP